jgi:hypothetical protein
MIVLLALAMVGAGAVSVAFGRRRNSRHPG